MSFSGAETIFCSYCPESVTFGCIVPNGWRELERIEGFKGLSPTIRRYWICSDRCMKLLSGLLILGAPIVRCPKCPRVFPNEDAAAAHFMFGHKDRVPLPSEKT